MTRARDNQRYGRGHDDGLDPLTPLDLAKVDGVDALVRAMSHTAFGGRRLGEAADVLEAMIRDRGVLPRAHDLGRDDDREAGPRDLRDDRPRLGERDRLARAR